MTYLAFVADGRDDRNADVDAAVPGIERLGLHTFELYRSTAPGEDDVRAPGAVVIVDVEFDGPDPARQRKWVDAVFEALGTDPGPDLPRSDRRWREPLHARVERDPGWRGVKCV